MGLKNFLISSTRQWNCGDEFIWFGIRNLLKSIEINGNFILYNRHPSINPRPRLWGGHFFKKQFAPHLDNSFSPERDAKVDYVIFAGTPEWDGKRLAPLFKFILRKKIPTLFLGIGWCGQAGFSAALRDVLKETARLVTGRDQNIVKLFKPWCRVTFEPCPALFAASEERVKKRKNLETIGLVLQAPGTTAHRISEGISEPLVESYKRLEKYYKVNYIAHYINDWSYAEKLGLSQQTNYSSYAEDYVSIYEACDLIISPRVHGCGLAASLGIPSISISHDQRAETVQGFKSVILPPESDFKLHLEQVDIETWSGQIIEHRRESFDRCRELLIGAMQGL